MTALGAVTTVAIAGDPAWADATVRVANAVTNDAGGASNLFQKAWEALLAAPAPIYFGFLVIALVGPTPVSVFYVAAGPIYGIGPALAWIAPTLALNALLVHAIGTTAIRP